jgi:hypothetical protein
MSPNEGGDGRGFNFATTILAQRAGINRHLMGALLLPTVAYR